MTTASRKTRDSGEPLPADFGENDTAEPFDTERFANQLRDLARSIFAATEARS
jgi:hypothetical protein